MTSLPYPFISTCSEGVRLRIHLQPGARNNLIVGTHGDSLKIQIKARPIDGEANRALIAFLGKALKVKKSSITLLKGESSRQKLMLIAGYDTNSIILLLEKLMER